DFSSYWQLFEAVSLALRPPDLLVYLQADLNKLRQQIRLRGRGYEAGISDDYLLQLHELYEEWISGFDASKVLVIPSSNLDFVHDEADRQHVFGLLERHGLSAPLL